MGRWYQVDPMAERFSHLSAYVYTNNNPILFSDPTGLFSVNQIETEDTRVYDKSGNYQYTIDDDWADEDHFLTDEALDALANIDFVDNNHKGIYARVTSTTFIGSNTRKAIKDIVDDTNNDPNGTERGFTLTPGHNREWQVNEVFTQSQSGNHFSMGDAISNTKLSGKEFGVGHTHADKNAGDGDVSAPSGMRKGNHDYGAFLKNHDGSKGPHLSVIGSRKGITIYSSGTQPKYGNLIFPGKPSVKINYQGRKIK